MKRAIFLLGVVLKGQTTLAELERLAVAASPALEQSAAEVRAAEGRVKQAGLYPNPVLGATGDHNSPVLNGGSLGGFIEQRFVTGGKLGLDKKAADEVRLAAAEMGRAAELRVRGAIRKLFYQGLAEQRLIESRRQMAELSERTAATARELKNVGQADQPDVLEAELDAERARLAVTLAANALSETWREIGALVPGAKQSLLEGNLEELPKVSQEEALARVMAESPRIQAAEREVARAGWAVKRAKAEIIPDVVIRGGVRYNREIYPAGPVGPEGYFDAGVAVPLFNRNQGAKQAAQAESEAAKAGVERERQMLKVRFAETYRRFADAQAAAARYRDGLLPRAREGYRMYQENFREMAAAYPKVLGAQRTLIQLEEEYLMQLQAAWRAEVDMEALLEN